MLRADTLRGDQKAVSQSVRTATPDARPAVLERAKALAAEVKEAEVAEAAADLALRAAQLAVPNVVEGAPPGGEDDFVVLREVGAIPDIAEPKDHLELGEGLRAIDTERGAKVSGARFYFLTGVGALLQLGLLQLAMQQAVENGFTPMITPSLVAPQIMEGTGYLGAHASEIYRLEADDLYLVGTSEVPLAGYHAGEVLDLSDGPRRYAGWSSCFRREAGSYGKDTRGIIRVHQFDKVEMFVYADPADAAAEHERLLAWEEEMLAKIEVPYRVIDTAAGDLGSSAARKFDCEAWFPSQAAYRELTSTSITARRSRPAGSTCDSVGGHRQAADLRDAERHPRTHPVAGGDPGEPPAARRVGRRPRRAAPVGRRPRGPDAGVTGAGIGARGFGRRVVVDALPPRPRTTPTAAAGDGPAGGHRYRRHVAAVGRDPLLPQRFSALRRLSVPYVLVTGRPQRWIEHLATEIGHAGVAIAVNGALTYDLATGEVIRVR